MSLRVDTVEVHAEGEPARVVVDGDRFVRGHTMAERFDYCVEQLDGLRRLLLREPRGGPAMCGAFITSAEHPDSDFGVIVLEQGGFTPMSGSNTMCAVAAALHAGVVEPAQSVVRIDTAVGTVVARPAYDERTGRLTQVSVDNVPAYVVELQAPLDLPGVGTVAVDVVFGGQFFVQLSASSLGVDLSPANGRELAGLGAMIKAAANEQLSVQHPDNPSINSVNLVMIHSGDPGSDLLGSNTVVLSHGTVSTEDPASWIGTLDRSPCGTGTSARMAALHERGLLSLDQRFVHRSIIGTTFVGELLSKQRVDGRTEVRPRITGRAWVTGEATWLLDDTDPFPRGFTVADVWAPDA